MAIHGGHKSASHLPRLAAGMPVLLCLATDLIGDGSDQQGDLGLQPLSVLTQ